MRYPPPIVAQVDPLRVSGDALVVLPVGVTPWAPEHTRTTVIVKTTYGFDLHAAKPELTLLAEQPALAGASAEANHGVEIAAPDDFVRAKTRADVLLTGFAYANRATDRIGARLFAEGHLDLAFSTVGPSPIERMPLGAGYLQTADGSMPIPPVGPIRAREVLPASEQEDNYGLTDAEKVLQYQAALAALAAGEWKPWEDAGVEAPLPPDAFDDSAPDSAATLEGGLLEPTPGRTWDDLPQTVSITDRGVQHAAAHLTCPFIEPGSTFVLEGLLPGGQARSLRLPDHDVLVIAEASVTYDVTMEIDTVEINTASGRLALTWRGQIPEDIFERSSVRLIVSLALLSQVPEVDDIFRNLPRGSFSRAATAADADVGAVPKNDIELNVARQMTFDRTPDPMLQLEEYTDLVAAISAEPDQREVILERHRLTPTDWMLEERAWMETIGKLLQRGDLEAVDAYNKMITRKRRAAKVNVTKNEAS